MDRCLLVKAEVRDARNFFPAELRDPSFMAVAFSQTNSLRFSVRHVGVARVPSLLLSVIVDE